MNKTGGAELTAHSKVLRKKMTKEERHLWYDFLKSLPITINRQKVIGNYIVDFYCAKARLVIELDGAQHYEEAGKQSDLRRDKYLTGLGMTVLRFSNLDINRNFQGVCLEILKYLPAPDVPR